MKFRFIELSQLEMQNAECIMQNEGVVFDDGFQLFSEGKYRNYALSIMNYALLNLLDKLEFEQNYILQKRRMKNGRKKVF